MCKCLSLSSAKEIYEESAVERYKVPNWYVSNRRHLGENFSPDNYVGVVEQSTSPCNNYFFVVEKYVKNVGSWQHHYFRGTIYQKTGTEVAAIESNACHFWHCWVRKDDKTYLLCNEDSHGYTTLEAESGEKLVYIDPKTRNGLGFAWKKVVPSPDGEHLAVQGSYGNVLNEIFLYEFTPSKVPFPKKKRLDKGHLPNSLTLSGWKESKVVMLNSNKIATVEVGV